jgi:ABC-type antimicrobial peptide transport system permease subunit
VGLILRDAAFVVGCGLLLAAPLAWFALLLIRSQLYGMTLNQPLLYVGAVLLLIVASVAAALVPARHAAKSDAVRALRYE